MLPKQTLHIGIAGPIATEYVAHLLHDDTTALPAGYSGAPLLATLIEALLARGHRITAFTTSADLRQTCRTTSRANSEGLTIYYVPARPTSFRPQGGRIGRAMDGFRVERQELERVMREAKPDVIHAHWIYEFGLAAIASGLPHLVTCHDAPQAVLRHMPNLYRLVRYFMGRRCLARAQHLTAVSPYLRDKLAHYAHAPLEVVPNPLSPDLTAREIDLAHLPAPHAPRLAMVANGWGALKNPQPAMRAFARLRARIPGARLQLYGTDFGPNQAAAQWARQQGIDAGMEFIGRIAHTRLYSALATTDVLLHPSLEESFGMSVAEAMALGVPVIGGTHSGAVPWVIGDGGLVTDVTSASAIETSVNTLLQAPEYRRLRTAAVARTRALFSIGQITDIYISHYCHLIDKTGTSTPNFGDSRIRK